MGSLKRFREFRFPWRHHHQISSDVEDELRFHLDMRAAELEKRGLDPKEARRRAVEQFGDVERTRERLNQMTDTRERRADILHLLDDLLQDIRYTGRTLLRTPGFTLVAVFVLALGIGANTALFSLINALLLRPPGIPHPDTLIGITSRSDERPDRYRGFSYAEYDALRRQASSFDNVMAHTFTMVGVREGETTRRVAASLVSGNYFATFGVAPTLGRPFTVEEERPGADVPVAVLSHAYWERLGGPEHPDGLLGSTINVNGRTLDVVGVAPAGFTGTTALFSPDLWMPLGLYELVNTFGNDEGLELADAQNRALMLAGRLREGSIPEAADTELQRLGQQLAETYPELDRRHTLMIYELPRLAISDGPVSEAPVAVAAALLMGLASIVLLIACLDLANMLIARGTSRRNEISIRLALGGGRGRLMRQLLTEGLVLSLLGGAAGLLASLWLLRVATNALSSMLPMMVLYLDTSPDLTVLVATLAFCILSTLFFALGPSWSLTRGEGRRSLRTSESGLSAGRSLLAPRNLLVIAQIALTLVLLVAGGLFVRGVLKAGNGDPGFELEDGLVAELDPSLLGYDEARSERIYSELLERLRGLSGVRAASLSDLVPFGNVVLTSEIRVPGSGGADEETLSVLRYVVSDGYFATLGLPVLRGRGFEPGDGEPERSAVAVIDEPLAERLWPGTDVVGQRLELMADDGESSTLEIVGLVPGLRHDVFDQEPRAHLYLPFGRSYTPNMHLHVRLDPAAPERAMLEAVRTEIRALDTALPILSLQSLESHRDTALSLWMLRAGARVLGGFATLGLVLAVVGVYGLKAFVVSRRTREIGVRMALGASASRVRWMILKEGMALTAIGLGIGLVLALILSNLLSSFLFGVGAGDPLTLGGASLLLAAASLLAAYLPARRATRIEPTQALRCE